MNNTDTHLDANSLRSVISSELELHPQLILLDIYKLVFQAFCGPSHIINDPKIITERIYAEVIGMQGSYQPRLQDIGNNSGYCRVSLDCVKYDSNMCALPINEVRYRCNKLALSMHASCDPEAPKISSHWAWVKPVIFPLFNAPDEQWAEVDAMAGADLLPHHSEIFSTSYNPHYRLIHTNTLKSLLPLFN